MSQHLCCARCMTLAFRMAAVSHHLLTHTSSPLSRPVVPCGVCDMNTEQRHMCEGSRGIWRKSGTVNCLGISDILISSQEIQELGLSNAHLCNHSNLRGPLPLRWVLSWRIHTYIKDDGRGWSQAPDTNVRQHFEHVAFPGSHVNESEKQASNNERLLQLSLRESRVPHRGHIFWWPAGMRTATWEQGPGNA